MSAEPMLENIKNRLTIQRSKKATHWAVYICEQMGGRVETLIDPRLTGVSSMRRHKLHTEPMNQEIKDAIMSIFKSPRQDRTF